MRKLLIGLGIWLLVAGAASAANYPPGASTGQPTGAAIVRTLGAQLVPTNNNVCWVGDSITFATLAQNTTTITASGGTGPYTFTTSGFPATITTTTSSPLFTIVEFNAVPGTYPVSITATDALSATRTENYTLTISTNYIASLTDLGSGSGALVQTITARTIADQNRGGSFWVPFLTNRTVVSPQTDLFGLSGDTTTGLLTRLAAPEAASCGSAVVMIGTNDLNNSNNPSLATVEGNLTSIWKGLINNQRRNVFAMKILPRTMTGNQNALDMLWSLNWWTRTQNGSTAGLFIEDSSLYYGNPLSTVATPCAGATTDYRCSYDGLHPAYGAYFAFAPIAAMFNQLYTPLGSYVSSASDLYSTQNVTGNLMPNGMMSFTGGTGAVSGRVVGTAPDGWTGESADSGCSPCSFTGTASSATLSDGTPAAQMVVAGTAGGGYATQVFYNYSTTTLSNLSIGDKLQASCRVEMSAGSAHVTTPYLLLTYNSGGVTYNLNDGAPVVSDASPSVAYSGTLATPTPAPALTNIPSGTLQILIGVFITNPTGTQTINASFKVGACALRKIT